MTDGHAAPIIARSHLASQVRQRRSSQRELQRRDHAESHRRDGGRRRGERQRAQIEVEATRDFSPSQTPKSPPTACRAGLGAAYGSGRMTSWSSALNTATFEPMPSASTMAVPTAKVGDLRRSRRAYRRSESRSVIAI
jgi:hypothetical protein